MSKNKHLRLEQRILLEKLVTERKSTIHEIAILLEKHHTTISKELKLRRIFKDRKDYGTKGAWFCINFNECVENSSCHLGPCKKGCISCNIDCTKFCKQYQEKKCEKLEYFPYVCNGCDKINGCRLSKFFYRSQQAQNDYKDILVNNRTGINMLKSDLIELDELVSPLVRNGQSINHIIETNKDKIGRCSKTIYNYVSNRYLSVIDLDLPRKVSFKARKNYNYRKNIEEKKAYLGRTYQDFQKFIYENPDYNIVQIDTVEGNKGGPLLLTIHFVNFHFMLAYLINDKTTDTICDVFNRIEYLTSYEDFKFIFPVILTDRGVEFARPEEIESSYDNCNKRTKVFYCDSYASYQKGAIERNHQLIRYYLPKGKSFESLDQDKVNLMVSHINSYKRKSINYSSPYDLALVWFGKNILDALGIVRINPSDVILNPKLLK